MPRRAWQRLPERAKQLFGIELDEAVLARFARHLDLVEAWSRRMNLVSVRSREELIDRHVLDSLAPARFVRGLGSVADFGSGAGFPGIPLAVIVPETRFHLVESRQKRAAFLRHVVRSLALNNVRVIAERGDTWNPDGPIDAVLGRAIAPYTLAGLADRVLTPAGCMIAMKKYGGTAAAGGFIHAVSFTYELPGGEKHEVALLRRPPNVSRETF